MARSTIRERLARLDWSRIEADLWEYGSYKTGSILTVEECTTLIETYRQQRRFRSTIDMERYRFGRGEYRYFAYPLPRLVASLRVHAYRHLAPVANRWAEALGSRLLYPSRLKDFLAHCHQSGQTRPTPLLLKYEAGGYNCLHQDLYGDIAFPIQLLCVLSREGIDYEGGDFLLVEQRPRSQSRGEAIRLQRGEMVFFTNRERPVLGRAGNYRVQMRHGASRLHSGMRYTLGVIFHDAH